MNFSAFYSCLDFFNRLEGAISTFINADWKGARQRNGMPGFAVEFVSSFMSYNSPVILVPRNGSWRGIDIENLLYRHGVKVWDRGILGDNLAFRVKRRQVKWAEYLLLRAGIPVMSTLVEPDNRVYAAGYPPGSEPPSHKSPAPGRRPYHQQSQRR